MEGLDLGQTSNPSLAWKNGRLKNNDDDDDDDVKRHQHFGWTIVPPRIRTGRFTRVV